MYFLIILRLILLRMKNVSDKIISRENQNTFCFFFSFFLKNLAVNEMWIFFLAGQATDENMAHSH